MQRPRKNKFEKLEQSWRLTISDIKTQRSVELAQKEVDQWKIEKPRNVHICTLLKLNKDTKAIQCRKDNLFNTLAEWLNIHLQKKKTLSIPHIPPKLGNRPKCNTQSSKIF